VSVIANREGHVGWVDSSFLRTASDGISRSEPVRWAENNWRDVEHSAHRSSFLYGLSKTARWVQEVRRATWSMWRVENGWNSYGAEAPNRKAIESAMSFAERAVLDGVQPVRIEPSAEGGVAVAFIRGQRRAIAEFLNCGDWDLFLYDKLGNPADSDEFQGSFGEMISMIRDYLHPQTEADC
jgi:hypothetical protein